MSAWLSLTRKEIRLGLPVFLVPVVAFFLLTGIAYYIGNRQGFGWEAVVGVSIAAVGVQVFYLVFYLFCSLQSERKRLHLWLHNPMPGYLLLLAKIAAGFLSLLVTLLVTGSTLLIAFNLADSISEHLQIANFLEMVFFIGSHILLIALSFAALFLFFWMIFLVFTRYLGTFLSFLSTFILFIATATLYSWFSSSIVYEKLNNWGLFELNMLEGISINVENGSTQVFTETDTISLYAGTYLFETVIALLLFLAASWLLDKKAEV
ncbi:hypothetical protein [Sediminibacillus massiliensis]|uniref:hypothetical protein n=1 Tax=Sediminibacillus massiliensis TaxID=1926277 RepID=UPI0009889091|nr:hypothetical protein [Sediminibacillus massiliensis]